MRTFSIETLGCKVNQYESEQIATLLRRRGLVHVDSALADLRIVNTCSVTVQAASKSRQSLRRMIRLPVLSSSQGTPQEDWGQGSSRKSKVIATGCYATSDPHEAARLGVDAVVTHHDDVAAELDRLLDLWNLSPTGPTLRDQSNHQSIEPAPKSFGYDESIIEAGASAPRLNGTSKPEAAQSVKRNTRFAGTHALPLLDSRQDSHQRALLKVQDGCDAHCTYCIIPQLRGDPWSKPLDDVVEEARRMIDSGHREIVLTGIFLGAFGQPTAIRKRQSVATAKPLARLVDALCTRVHGLRRLRFSSLEPGDLTPDLIDVLRSHPQCVPHFHLPLQSGSNAILRRMNRQYTRDDFLRMIDEVHRAFDRPAITTDIIVGFPGETDVEFEQTLDIVNRVKFIQIHAFHFSPRPGTAAARWVGDFVPGVIVNRRIDFLKELSSQHSLEFRRQFIGSEVSVLVERPGENDENLRHGRCERYFDMWFESNGQPWGELVRVRIERVVPQLTWGVVVPK